MKNGELYFKTKDGTSLWVHVQGQGRPLLLCHGWLCSSRFWQRNEAELAKHFQVITFDLRGFGKSQKTLQGHTIAQYAADIHEMITEFGLQNVILGGWSLGGPVVLSYWQQFAKEARVTALMLIDMTPFPFSPAEWNSHGLRNFNSDGFNQQVNTMINDRENFLTGFYHKCFHAGVAPVGSEWALEEMHHAPTWIAVAAYSDYLFQDFTAVLSGVTVPTLVMNADSPIFPRGIEQGKHLAASCIRGEFLDFPGCGHTFFYEAPERFNQAVIQFGKE